MSDPQGNDNATVEMAHEGLIREWPLLHDWLEEDREPLLVRDGVSEAAQDWNDHGREDGYLAHREERLGEARALVSNPRMRLNALEQDYLRASVTAELAELETQRERVRLAEALTHESEQRVAQKSKFLRIATALAIAAAALFVVALISWVRAQAQSDVSLARALAAQAIGEHDSGDDQRAALLARQAWLFDPEGAAREQIGTALQATVGAPFFSTIWDEAEALPQALTSLALGQNGRYLAATSSNQKTIRIWDRDHPRNPPLRLTCHGGVPTSVAFSPDGKYLSSGSASGGVILWNLEKLAAAYVIQEDASGGDCAQGLERRTLAAGGPQQGEVRAVTFWQDDEGRDWVIAGGCKDTSERCSSGSLVRIWNAAAAGEPESLDVTGGHVWAVAVSGNGWLAAGTCPKLVKNGYCDSKLVGRITTWDLETWSRSATAADPVVLCADGMGNKGGVAALAFDPDGDRLVSGGGDRDIRLWELGDSPPTCDELNERDYQDLRGHDAEIRALAFSPDGLLLASASQDETVRIWDMRRQAPERAIAVLSGKQWVRALAFAEAGEGELVLAATGAEGAARVWRIWQHGHSLSRPALLRGHDHFVRGLAFASNEETLASSGEDGTVRLWDAASALPDAPVSQLGDEVDKDTMGDDEVKITAVAYSRAEDAGSRYLAAGDERGKIWVRDLNDAGAEFEEIGQHDPSKDNGVTAVAFSPAASLLVSGGMDGTVRFWDPAGAELGEPLVLGDVDVRALAFNDDGTMLAAGGCQLNRSVSCEPDTGFVVIWDVASTGATEGSLVTDATLYRCVGGSRASVKDIEPRKVSFLCNADEEDAEKAADLDEREPQRMFGGVASIAFGPAGSGLLATGHASHGVVVWDVAQAVRADADYVPRFLGEHDGEVRAVAFSPATGDGSEVILASGSTDQTVRLWSPWATTPAERSGNSAEQLLRVIRGIKPAGHALAVIGGRDEFVRTLAFSPLLFPFEDNSNPELPSVFVESPILASAAADSTIRLSITSSDALAAKVCDDVWRNLSQREWDRFVGPNVTYQLTCENLPYGEGTAGASATPSPAPGEAGGA